MRQLLGTLVCGALLAGATPGQQAQSRPGDSPVPPPPGLSQNFYPWFVTFSLNGYAHGSMPLKAITVRKGERVRWYVMSSTNDFDFHTPHWHGNVVTANKMRTDVAFMGPMQMVTADMVPDNEGIWLLDCHVSFHNTAGMNGRYAVGPARKLSAY